jgi:hypothetical protein
MCKRPSRILGDTLIDIALAKGMDSGLVFVVEVSLAHRERFMDGYVKVS